MFFSGLSIAAANFIYYIFFYNLFNGGADNKKVFLRLRREILDHS
jgi:hypothetical protein